MSEFLKFFGKGSESDKNVHATMHRIPVRKAQQLVLERIESKLKGGPGGLRLAFKFFDRDRSGMSCTTAQIHVYMYIVKITSCIHTMFITSKHYSIV